MTKFAFVFPGQGSQSLNMLNAFADHAVVRATVAEASEVLDQDVWSLIENGPKEALDLTTNTQPVMLTAAVALYRAWISAGGMPPAMVAGHSLGEYSALVAAGAIEFADAVAIVRFRAEAMQQAVPVGEGTMAVILGLDDATVRAVCEEAAVGTSNQHPLQPSATTNRQVVEAVNYNAPAQVVIAGHTNAVNRACEIAKVRGAKRAMLLPVSAPFHSSLLQPASIRLKSYLSTLSFSKPTIPVINNVDVAIVEEADDIKDALIRQAASPVRWVETIESMASQGVTHIIECGPGKVLTGLTKRIAPDLIGDALITPNSIVMIKEMLQ
jgi:[acyl-carrier-protein] S-malonyltransferase